jgi:hypothetical protein
MTSIDNRAQQAQAAWAKGQAFEASGRLEAAHACYRDAHDLVVDCPKMHRMAHQHLKRLNTRRGSYRELMTDLVLLGLAPLGVFEAVAYLMKGQVLGSVLCARRQTKTAP